MGNNKKIHNNLINDLEDNIEATTAILGYIPPDCPNCGTQLKFSFSADIFQCPSCGYTVDKEDGENLAYSDNEDYDDIYKDVDEKPEVCNTCGGPYPSCSSGCKLIEED